MQLEGEGFEVLHAETAEAALVMAAQQPLALITLDILLPGVDGWELLGRLKRVPELTFSFDESIEKNDRIEQILQQLNSDRAGQPAPPRGNVDGPGDDDQ